MELLKPEDVINGWLEDIGYSLHRGGLSSALGKTYQYFPGEHPVFLIKTPSNSVVLITSDKYEEHRWVVGWANDSTSDEEIKFHDPDVFEWIRGRYLI